MKKIFIYWRDIPSAVIVKRGRKSGKAQLSHRFQDAIDRAAMRAGKGGSDAYIAEWRRVSEPCEQSADPEQIAKQAADAIEASYTDEQLTALIRAHGKAPEGDDV